MIKKMLYKFIAKVWALIFSFVEAGCKQIFGCTKKYITKIEKHEKQDKVTWAYVKDSVLFLMLCVCLILFPVSIYALVFGAVGLIIYFIWNAIHWLIISLLPAPFIFASKGLTWIAFLILPFILILNAVWKFLYGTKRGLEDEGVTEDLVTFMFGIFNNSRDILRDYCIKPFSRHEIFDKDMCHRRFKKEICLMLNVVLKEGVEVSGETTIFIKNALQNKINASIENGDLDYEWAYEDTGVKIVKVADGGGYLCIDIILVRDNTEKSVTWRADNPIKTSDTCVNDEDDDFYDSE
jgi:hypothetical protein